MSTLGSFSREASNAIAGRGLKSTARMLKVLSLFLKKLDKKIVTGPPSHQLLLQIFSAPPSRKMKQGGGGVDAWCGRQADNL